MKTEDKDKQEKQYKAAKDNIPNIDLEKGIEKFRVNLEQLFKKCHENKDYDSKNGIELQYSLKQYDCMLR